MIPESSPPRRLLLVHTWAGLPARQELYIGLQAKTGWRMQILTVRRWRDDYGRTVEAERAPDLEGELVALPVGMNGNIPLHYFKRRLGHLVREFEPDCVYIYHEPYAVMTWQVLHAAKAVTTAPVGIRSSQNILKHYPFPFRRMEREVYSRSDFAVTVSENVADVMRAKGYAKPIYVIPMPVDVEVFKPAERRALAGPLRIGFVGRLVPEKGIDTALWALSKLKAETATLTVVGDGPQRIELANLAKRLSVEEMVTWQGSLSREATAVAYRELDVIVVPSRATARWAEQFGRVVIEAAASGVPSIVTRSGELPHLVEKIGIGWTVAENDAGAMADTLRYLADNRSELVTAAETARDRVVEGFADGVIVGMLGHALGSVMRSGR
jgi:L-malate glycosyltransferase